MNRDQKIRIAMVVCIVVLLCAVIITSTGLFGGTGIGGYADADQYTSGDADISGEIRNLDVIWTSGRVMVAYHPENTVTLRENAKRPLSEDEELRWWLDGDTLRIRFSKPGIRLNMPEKELTVTLPEGIVLNRTSIETTSGEIGIPELKTEALNLASTSGDIRAAAEVFKAELNSTSGDAQIRLTGRTEDLRINSTSGDLSAEAENAGIIDAGSTSGSIRITVSEAENVKAGSTSGSIEAVLGKIGILNLAATSGSITAALPPEPGFTAHIDTTSGDIAFDHALTRNGKEYVCGDGSAAVRISTTSGNVRLEALEK